MACQYSSFPACTETPIWSHKLDLWVMHSQLRSPDTNVFPSRITCSLTSRQNCTLACMQSLWPHAHSLLIRMLLTLLTCKHTLISPLWPRCTSSQHQHAYQIMNCNHTVVGLLKVGFWDFSIPELTHVVVGLVGTKMPDSAIQHPHLVLQRA